MSRPGLRALLPYLRPHTPALLGAALCVLGGAASAMALVPLARHMAAAFGHLTLGDLNFIVASLVGLYALKSAFGFGQAALAQRVALAATARLREDAFGNMLELELGFFARHRAGDLSSRLVQDLGVVKDALAALVADVVPAVAIVSYSLGYAVWLNWRLALATFIGAPLVAVAIAAFGRRLNAQSTQVQARVSDVFVHAAQTLGALAVVKAFGRGEHERQRFAAANQRHRAVTYQGALIQAAQPAVIALLQTAAIGAVLWVGGYEITQGRLAAPDLIAFAAAIAIGIDPTLALGQAWGRLQAASGALARVLELLDANRRMKEPADPAPLGPVQGALTCQGLAFAYEAGRPVIDGIDMAIAPGELVALVGGSGGGKSTLAALLLRLYDPQSGSVMLDGRDMRGIATAELRRAIAYVPQDPTLFAGTVAENVAYGRPEATQAEIEAACRAAGAHAFIVGLVAGYATEVGERGAALSGGQRQRVAIARALIADPRVLILDEATAALDAHAASELRETLATARVGRTTVMIAHRLEAIAHADRVFVIENGRVIEHGSPQALMATAGAFSRLIEAARHDLSS